MRIIKLINIFIFMFVSFHLKAQKTVSEKIVNIEFHTIEKESNDVIIGSVIEIVSNGKRIGIVHGDYDGISKFQVASNKIEKGELTLNVYGMKCKPFQNKYNVHNDAIIKIYLEYGATKYQTLENRKLVLADLNVPLFDLEEVDDSYGYLGIDTNPQLTQAEAEYLNSYLSEKRNGFDFQNKKVIFVTGNSGNRIGTKKQYFEYIKKWNDKNSKVATGIDILSDEEKIASGGYDVIITYWVKVFTKKRKRKILKEIKKVKLR